MWSDGDTIWVVGRDDRKVYAYHLRSKVRQPQLDFALHGSNQEAMGLWGDSGFLYVVNGGKGGRKVFAYYLPEPELRVSAITLSAITPVGATATAWVSYHGDIERTIHLRYRPYTVAQWTDAAGQRPVDPHEFRARGVGRYSAATGPRPARGGQRGVRAHGVGQ